MIERDVMELRARVAKLERALDFVTKHLGVHVPADVAPAGVSPHVAALARQGNKLGAIMAHQKETGADLATAKRIVDEIT